MYISISKKAGTINKVTSTEVPCIRPNVSTTFLCGRSRFLPSFMGKVRNSKFLVKKSFIFWKYIYIPSGFMGHIYKCKQLIHSLTLGRCQFFFKCYAHMYYSFDKIRRAKTWSFLFCQSFSNTYKYAYLHVVYFLRKYQFPQLYIVLQDKL